MNTFELNNILFNDNLTKKLFQGTFPCNSLKIPTKFPSFLIANTEEKTKKGQHWVLIFFPAINHVEFFDPLANPPNKCLSRFLKKFKNVKINRIRIQSLFSNNCGQLCILFSIFRSQGLKFENIPYILLKCLS